MKLFFEKSHHCLNLEVQANESLIEIFLGKSQNEKPSIIVSGADDGRVYLLRPRSWSEYIWHYDTDIILHRENSRIGVPAVADVDGDGNVEVFVPEKNYIHVLTFQGKIVPNEQTFLRLF